MDVCGNNITAGETRLYFGIPGVEKHVDEKYTSIILSMDINWNTLCDVP